MAETRVYTPGCREAHSSPQLTIPMRRASGPSPAMSGPPESPWQESTISPDPRTPEAQSMLATSASAGSYPSNRTPETEYLPVLLQAVSGNTTTRPTRSVSGKALPSAERLPQPMTWADVPGSVYVFASSAVTGRISGTSLTGSARVRTATSFVQTRSVNWGCTAIDATGTRRSASERNARPMPTAICAGDAVTPVAGSTTQWAAVTTVVGVVSAAPQNCDWKMPSTARRSVEMSAAM